MQIRNQKSDSAAQNLSQDELAAQSSAVSFMNGTSAVLGNNVELSLNLKEGQKASGQH